MDLELVSFKLCPFVQRSKITLAHKDVPHKTTYIELDDPPAWFQERSPLGLVPILTVDGKETLFESAVINEYLDEVTGGDLLPKDPLQKAKARAWIEFASACMGSMAQMLWATDQETFQQHRDALRGKLRTLEGRLGDGPYFLGERFSLVDTSFAPLLQRIDHMNQEGAVYDAGTFPKVEAWTKTLLALPEVKASIVPEWRDLQVEYLQKKGSYLVKEQTTTA